MTLRNETADVVTITGICQLKFQQYFLSTESIKFFKNTDIPIDHCLCVGQSCMYLSMDILRVASYLIVSPLQIRRSLFALVITCHSKPIHLISFSPIGCTDVG